MMGYILGLAGLLLCLSLSARAGPINDWSDGVKKASSHDHWEHIVKRQSRMSFFDRRNEKDDTSHIVNIQDYYRSAFEEGWDNYEDNERKLFNMLNNLESVIQNQGRPQTVEEASAQEKIADIMDFGIHTKPIPGRFIVMLQDTADDHILDQTMSVLEKAHRVSGKKIRFSDMQALRFVGKGFTATMNSLALSLIAKHPLLLHVEEDTALRRSQVLVHEDGVSTEEDNRVQWNLDRLDQHGKKLDNQYNPAGDGKNVDIHVIDTGIMATHEEFEGRASDSGYDAVDDLTGSSKHGVDCNGHGTHCSATAAGKTYGVAKKATIISTRALNCEGTGAVSGIVVGMDKIIQSHKESKTGRPKVLSQSLGVKKSVSLNRAIQEAVKAGIQVAGAAGNQGSYSCDYSPPSAKVGISVGATDRNDEVTIFTNTGECTDIMAPGSMIKSASIECNTCTKTMSGTSMATPHVAGAAAILLGMKPQLNAVDLKKKMVGDSTKNMVMMSSIANVRAHNTPNRLLFVQSSKGTAEGDTVEIQEDDYKFSRP